MKRLFTTLLMLVAVLQAFAQSTSVTGSVQSGSDKTALPGANVVLTRTTDATKTVTATDGEGRFRFERVAQGQYTLEINYIGFQNFSRTVQVAGAPLNLGALMLQDGSTAIKEVQIIGRAPLGEQKGDTSQFNAKAFKTAPDASAEDLVTKMPGVTVQDGKIQAQGEDVQQVMIDGKRFTGDDVNSAVRNLSADMIESVQVFDGQSDRAAFSGFDDGNRVKTLNFVTKKELRHGYVGKASAGYGTDERYMLGATVNYFKGNQRITATGLTNNINMFDFSIGETPGGGMRGRRSWGGGGSPNGIINTNTFGLDYNDIWGKKIEVGGNYNYSNRDVVNNQYRFRDFVNSDTTYTENSLNKEISDSHRFNFRLQYNINKNNRLLVRPNITIQHNESLVSRNANTIANENLLTNSINSENKDNASLNLGNSVLFSHRFGDSGRILTTEIETRYSNTEGDTYQRENTTNLMDEDRNVDRNQFIKLDKGNFTWSGNVDYSQRLAEKSRLQLEYNISNRTNDSDRRTYDYVEGEGYSAFNTPLSNTFQSDYLSQRFGPSYQFRSDKASFQLNARYQYATLRGDSEFPQTYFLKKNFNNVLPSAEYEYKFSKSTNLRINYRTSTNEPSVEQLQGVLDISNPLRPSIGNPSLGQEYQNRLFMRFRNFNAETNKVFFMGIFGTMTDNYITNSVYTRDVPFELPANYTYRPGARFSRPVNLDGYWSVRSFFNYGQPINFISSNFNVNGSVGYSRTPGMIDEEINYANNTNFRVGLNLSSNISEKVDFNVSTNGSYNLVENTLRTNQNNNYYTHTSNLRLNTILWKGIVYRTELNHQYNSGLSAGVDNSYLLWNMSLGKKVFKNQQGEISLSVNDLLKQNVSIDRNIAADYVEDVQSTVLQRYFMLTFTYNLRKFMSGAAAPEMNENRNGNWGGRPGGH